MDFKIYNYAEFYTVASYTTGADGTAALDTGLGDMLVWAQKDGRFGFAKADSENVTVRLDHSIGERFWLCYNAGLEWDGETAEPTTFLALAIGCNITGGLGTYIESYNYLNSEGSQHMTEIGFTCLVSRRVQLDIETDLDLLNLGKYYSVGCGVSWLIN